jgi:hypothetical protein
MRLVMKEILFVFVVLPGISCSPRTRNTAMEPITFFEKPPKAERAFLSAYGSELLTGQYGIRIETEPLSFVNPDLPRELEPEILLSYLHLPSTNPAELENTRYSPASDATSSYEGSFYFLDEHNWVDLKEIRFLNATGNSILTEYDLVIHLPKHPPDEYPIVLRVQTEVKTAEAKLEAPRTVEGLGTLVQSRVGFWKGGAMYDTRPVEIELSANAASFEEIAAYARSVITQRTLPRSRMNKEIAKGLGFLADKFKMFNVSPDFTAEEFVPRRFYFYKRRHHEKPEVIIVLHHPADVGHWSLSFSGTGNGDLIWVPKSDVTPPD